MIQKKTQWKRRILLIILDGYGETKKTRGNAIRLAKKPFIDHLWKTYPHTLLKTDGQAVGIPKGNQGGSEVGHFTMGAGRIVFQTLEQINQDIASGKFFKNKILLKAIQNVKKNNSKLHLVGMISDQGVHSDIKHLFALMKLAKQHELKKVYIHAITDGRDVPEQSACKYIKQLLAQMKQLEIGQIATIIGRYFAMDRDRNWDRTQKAYELMTLGKGKNEKNSLQAIKSTYAAKDKSDYYIEPILVSKEGLVGKKDTIIFFNFRTDRARQLTEAFVNKKFGEFKTHHENVHFVAFGQYTTLSPVAFPTPKIVNNLGSVCEKNGLKQLRMAETEKYAHVTYFFNSQIKEPCAREDRVLIDSPKTKSYAHKPEMSAYELTKEACRQIDKTKYDLIVLNYANADLVGHSGDLKATIACIQVLDACLKKLIEKALEKKYTVLLTADHGNAEEKLYKDGSPCPSHSRNPVPFFLISHPAMEVGLKKGKGLKDITPTILHLLNIPKPKEMTGENLIDT